MVEIELGALDFDGDCFGLLVDRATMGAYRVESLKTWRSFKA
jgi:hypothetical protein